MITSKQRQRDPKTEAIRTLGLFEDGKTLVSANADCTLRLWSTDTKDFITILKARDRALINHLTFSPDGGMLFSGSFDGTILVWDLGNIVQKSR